MSVEQTIDGAGINEVYGDHFRQEAFAARVNHITDLISANFSNLNFQLRHDYSPLFRRGGMDPAQIEQIAQRTMTLNKNLLVLPIDKRNPAEASMLPYLLTIPAEYFRIIDMEHHKIYLVYVSTQDMEAY